MFDKKGRILLLKHSYRNKNAWRLPGGYVKGKEHPKEALEREIEEECGYVVSADKRLKIRTDRNSSRLDIIYMGIIIGGEFKKSEEIDEAAFFYFDTLPPLPKDQLIFIDRAVQVHKPRMPSSFPKS